MSQSIQHVREIYAAFDAGDVPRFLGYLDPQVRWCEAEGSAYADGNPYVGPEAVIAGVLARLQQDFDGFRVEVGEIVGGGDVVTMFGRYKATARASGRPLDVQAAHTWWLRDGKVVRFQQMVDTAGFAAALA
jgi:ketosteroid isomerase-like protein